MAPPVAPPGFGEKLPTQPGESIDTVMARKAKADRIAQQDADQRGLAINVANNPNQFNLAGFGSAGINAPSLSMFAKGGEVETKPEPEPEKGSAKAMLKEVGRSTQYLPADIAGAPVDLINLGLQGVDALTGSKLAQKMPVGGAEWLIDKANKYGLMDKPTGSLTETLTRLGTSVLSPTAGPKAAVAAGKAIKGTAKAALEDLAMAGTGQGGSKFAQTLMEPGTAFAVRPKGGVFLGSRSASETPLTDLDQNLQELVQGIDTSTDKGKEIANFFDKKVRNYYANQMGTHDDPIFAAMLQGRIPNRTPAPNSVYQAAREGNPQAVKKLRDAYDETLGLEGILSSAALKRKNIDEFDVKKDVVKKIKEQSPDTPTTDWVMMEGLSPQTVEKYNRLYGAKGFKEIVKEGEAEDLLRLFNKSDLPPHIRQAVSQAEPVFATSSSRHHSLRVNDLKDYLETRSPAEIKNMGVTDVVVKSREWHDLLEKAARSPDKFTPKQLFAGTSPLLKLEKDSWVDVKTPEALAVEGCLMGHCVGRLPSYARGVQEGTVKIYSLRDNKGVPHVTMQLLPDSGGEFNNIAQVKGTANTAAQKYYPQIDQFLTDYSAKIKKPLRITESPVDEAGVPFLPENWRNK
jgi:hypothetical protein